MSAKIKVTVYLQQIIHLSIVRGTIVVLRIINKSLLLILKMEYNI